LLPDKGAILTRLKSASREQLASTAFMVEDEESRVLKRWLENSDPLRPGTDRIIEDYHVLGKRAFSIQAGHRAVLVVSQNRFPGWVLKIDGQQRLLLSVDWAFIGIGLEAGNHEVELRYEPAGFRIGLWVSIGSLVLLPVFFLSSRRNKT